MATLYPKPKDQKGNLFRGNLTDRDRCLELREWLLENSRNLRIDKIIFSGIRVRLPHCEATVDGTRFPVRDLSLVLEGYSRRREDEVPSEWIDRVTVKAWTPPPLPTGSGYGYGYGSDSKSSKKSLLESDRQQDIEVGRGEVEGDSK